MTVVVAIISVIVVAVVVVGVHELGHFTFGKLFGIRVDEFAIGFGPRLLSRQFGETRYSLRAIPIGGFVRMAGMVGVEGEPDAGARNFFRAAWWKRVSTLLAGVVFNLLLAGVLSTVVFMAPVGSVVAGGGPAHEAGLRDNDSILTIDGQPVDHSSGDSVLRTTSAAVQAGQGRPLVVMYKAADGSVHQVAVKPALAVVNQSADARCASDALPPGQSFVHAIGGRPVGVGDPVRLLRGGGEAVHLSGSAHDGEPCNGLSFANVAIDPASVGGPGSGAPIQAAWRVGMALDHAGEPVIQAIADGWGRIPTFFQGQVGGLYQLVTNPATGGITGPQGLTGPVGIARETATSAQQGLRTFVEFIAFISLNLAFINLLPIPFLDGGKVVFVLVETLRGRRLDPRREAAIYAVSAALIGALAIYVTIGDIQGHH